MFQVHFNMTNTESHDLELEMNTFCQIYHITTFEVVFYHPSDLSVIFQ